MRANQHGGSFKAVLENKYDTDLKQILLDFRKKRLSYIDVSLIANCQVVTVRKWCKRYGVDLFTKDTLSSEKDLQDAISVFWRKLRSKEVNKVNVLSRKWA